MASTGLPGSWYVGMTWPPLKIPLNKDKIDPVTGQPVPNQVDPDDITGVSQDGLSMTIRDSQGHDAPGNGTFGIVTFNPAVVTYQFDATDVAVAGNIQLFIKAQYPGGKKVYDPIPISVAVD